MLRCGSTGARAGEYLVYGFFMMEEQTEADCNRSVCTNNPKHTFLIKCVSDDFIKSCYLAGRLGEVSRFLHLSWLQEIQEHIP